MNYLQNTKGAAQILLAFMMTAILGSAALVADIGVALTVKTDLSNGLDAAALAGGQELPADASKARAVATEYLIANDIDPADVQINITENNTLLVLRGTTRVSNHFARVLGVPETVVGASAAVKVGAAISAKGGLRPLAIADQPLVYGDTVILKEEGGDGTNGNYGAVSFGSSYGACIFREYLLNGYPGEVRVGDIIETEPGNMASSISTVKEVIASDPDATFSNYNRSSQRVWTIPVLRDWDVSGRDDVEVIGFAQFFIEDIKKNSGQAEITGKFIKFTTNGEIGESQTDYGVYGVKMIPVPQS